MKINIFKILLLSFTLCGIFVSCQEEKFTDSIFDTKDKTLDPSSYTYKLDYFLLNNYLEPYNLEFMYKMEDIATDVHYNLVPTSYKKSCEMAALTKYLWFDVYDKIAGADFLTEHGPRIIHLIGSPAYNPTSGTMILGLAEGGIKVSLFRVNDLDHSDVSGMNEFYFKTMHHEFAHILHQKKTYPKEYNLISSKDYNPLGWQNRHDYVALSLGFVSPYAGSQTREDFVEVIANYIVKTNEWWAEAFAIASLGWEQEDKNRPETVKPSEDKDGVDGVAVLLQKIDMCKEWLRTKWNLELDSIRNEVQYRQSNIDMNELMKPFE